MGGSNREMWHVGAVWHAVAITCNQINLYSLVHVNTHWTMLKFATAYLRNENNMRATDVWNACLNPAQVEVYNGTSTNSLKTRLIGCELLYRHIQLNCADYIGLITTDWHYAIATLQAIFTGFRRQQIFTGTFAGCETCTKAFASVR